MVNADIRREIFENELTYRQLAGELHLSHEHLSRLLAHPLSDQNRRRITAAVEQLKQRKQA